MITTEHDAINYAKKHVNEKVFLKLLDYSSYIIEWNKRFNLISSNTENILWSRHIIDSMQLNDFISKDDYIVDVGTGAGFPGLVLSIMGAKRISLIEPSYRKSSFLKFVSEKLNLNLEIHNCKIENLKLQPDYYVNRAFASFENFINRISLNDINKGLLFFLGENSVKETLKNIEKIGLIYRIKKSITNEKSYILKVIKNKQLDNQTKKWYF